ncbi:oxidoreductase [Alicyclobacillus contaminans]|uniref:aldo/keto reductase n=1 Tax=Alicyclobacillus contaminans TaxID=392016 RepID=UPI00041ABE22|nr:aldo/keto reductase [Alicyclobacillus contaminans]GMA52553.1 oxidoreductase [Alicyclobacillus contaminans]
METRRFGNTDMNVSVLGFGGAEIGFQNRSVDHVRRLLSNALDAGLNVIDTAECYADSESLIGEAVADRRQEFYLFTKCGHAAGMDGADWDPNMLSAQIDRSLRRLRTDTVDVIHLHSCSEEILRRGDVITVLQKAKEAGKTRYIGYSGDGRAALWAVESGLFDSLETSVNIADQEAIDLTIPKALERGMGVIAKRPIANAAWIGGQLPDNEYARPYWHRLQALNYDFLTWDAKASITEALRFTLSVSGVHTAIVGTAKPDRYRENAEIAARGPLAPEAYQAIRSRWQATAKPDWVGLT